MYQNVVSDKIVSFSRYIVIAEYNTKEEAERNLTKDFAQWQEQHKHKLWYKLAYPFAFATISAAT